jgi:hypothetical protein
MRVEPGAQVGVEAGAVVMGAVVVVARVVGVWAGVGDGRVEAMAAAAAARRRMVVVILMMVLFWVIAWYEDC